MVVEKMFNDIVLEPQKSCRDIDKPPQKWNKVRLEVKTGGGLDKGGLDVDGHRKSSNIGLLNGE